MIKKSIIFCIALWAVLANAQECAEKDTCSVLHEFSIQKVLTTGTTETYPKVLPLKADLMQLANEWKGTRYRYGGMSKQGTDCSGFVTRVLESAMPEVQLPRTSRDMYAETMRIPLSEAQPGDLLFFRNGTRLPISHVAIYLGEGYFAHATGYYGVIISHLSEDFHKRTFYAATRITEKNFKKTALK